MRSRETMSAVAVLAGLAWAAMSGPTLMLAMKGTFVAQVPGLRAVLVTLGDIAIIFILLRLLAGFRFATVLELSGVYRPAKPAVLAVLAAVAPFALLAFGVGNIALGLDPAESLIGMAFAPFFEELAFRGIALAILLRVCRWRFAMAVGVPAMLFGLAHLAQGEGPMAVAGIVAITGLGGLVFGWLWIAWGDNLWAPVAAHAALNILWAVFDLGDNAIGGWLGNAIRFGFVITLLLLTWKARHWFTGAPAKVRSHPI